MAQKRNLNIWAYGDGPLPDSEEKLIAEIKALAAARREDALTHLKSCKCDGCKIRRSDEVTQAILRRAS